MDKRAATIDYFVILVVRFFSNRGGYYFFYWLVVVYCRVLSYFVVHVKEHGAAVNFNLNQLFSIKNRAIFVHKTRKND